MENRGIERAEVWCWRKGVFRDRWLFNTKTGRVTRRVRLAKDCELATMAGWAKRCVLKPVAVFTPDNRRVVVQRGRRRVECGAPGTTTSIHPLGLVRSLQVNSSTGTIRFRDWVWAEPLLDPMDDKFLDMLARIIEAPNFALDRWDADAELPE